jgi:putative ABC transport system substrate-binding protein
LSRPGGNVTGLASISEELWLKRLQMLREFAPKISRIGVVMNPTNRGNASCLAEVRAAGLGLGMQVRALEVSDARTLEAMLAALAKEPPDAIASCWDSVTLEHAQSVADFALKRRLPSVASVREYVESGMLLSFGVNLPAQRRRAADLAHRIIKGEKPSDVPVEQPTHFELVLNMATVKALSLAIPPALGALVDDVYPPRGSP